MDPFTETYRGHGTDIAIVLDYSDCHLMMKVSQKLLIGQRGLTYGFEFIQKYQVRIITLIRYDRDA